MARPRKNDIDKRTRQLNIRLTESESIRLNDYAKTSKTNPAELVRQKVFTGKFPPAKMALLDIETYKELKKIGVNINQAVHKLNQTGEKIDYQLQSLQLLALLNKIAKAIANDRQSN